jgi:putative membrane protein
MSRNNARRLHMMSGFEGFGGAMGFGGIGMILFWGLVIAGVIMVARWLGGAGSGGAARGAERTALDILRERFARGEIDQQEFEQKRRVLGEN